MLSPTAWRSHATLVSVCTEASEPAFPSAGIRLAWRDHADLVIAEEIVRPRDLVLGHVTGYAVLRCFRARLRPPGTGAARALSRGVAREASSIVKRRRLFNLLMRIVTCGAANPHIRRVVALAVGQPVRLEADVVDVMWAVGRNLRPRAVALAAEIRHLLGSQLAQLRHPCVLDVAGLRRAGVLLAGPMAALAQHARRQPLHLHLAFTNRVGRMAAEAVRGVPNTHPAARGLLEGFGMQTRGAHGEIEPANRPVEADAALVPGSIPLINIRLAGGA